MKIADFKTDFEAKESLVLENSFGAVQSQQNVQLEVTIGYNSQNERGWFELNDKETGGEDWYAEGGFWCTGNEVTDYDGVFDLPKCIKSFLKTKGFNLDNL